MNHQQCCSGTGKWVVPFLDDKTDLMWNDDITKLPNSSKLWTYYLKVDLIHALPWQRYPEWKYYWIKPTGYITNLNKMLVCALPLNKSASVWHPFNRSITDMIVSLKRHFIVCVQTTMNDLCFWMIYAIFVCMNTLAQFHLF